ncbi:AAA family ATPase [Bacillus sp. F19]|nr:AAA family ATPase [Bacillus sp. F19]
MKPISLTISGLHSFREKQVIDFSSLCEGGVFGIFGPTGSGKSSILDAMTLALYGKVERAANNTQGILNHAENALHVSFTFELENASSSRRYSVERMFKRTDEQRVKTSLCRIMEHTEESVVLADKAAEVNEKVYDLLGLTIDDFTRAVVLPQGKFAEFLSLKGAERRQMLQRLFHLEQYGDELVKKLRKRLLHAKGKQNELTAEQAGLGDASSEAVKLAEQELQGANMLFEKRQKEYDQTVKQYEEYEEVWQLQLEKREYESIQSGLEQQKNDIAALSARLEAAEKADCVKPYAEALRSAELETNNSSTQMKELQQVLLQHEHRYAQIVNSYEQVREKKAAEEPILVARKEQLLQLRELEKGLKNELIVIKELTEKADKASKDLKEREEAAERANELFKKALEKQKTLKDQMDQNTVTVQEREQIRMASEQRFHLANMEAYLAEWMKRADKKETLVKHAEEQLRDARQKQGGYGTKIKECYGCVQQFYHRSCELLNVHQHQAETCKQRLLDEKNKAEKQRDQKMAAKLAKHLSHGDPCPVCGSAHHPEPAKETDVLETSGSLVEELEKKTAEDVTISANLQHLKEKWEELSREMISAYPFLSDLVVSLNDEENQDIDPRTEYKALNQDFLQTKERFHKLQSIEREWQEKINQYLYTQKNSEEDLKEMNEKHGQIESEYLAGLEKWNRQFSGISFEQAEEKQRQISEKDAVLEDLKARVKISVQFIEEKEKQIKQLEQEAQQIKNTQIELSASIQNRQQAADEKQKRLSQETVNSDIASLLKETERTLEELVQKEKNLYNEWQTALQDVQKAESSSHAAEKAFEHAELRSTQAKAKWEQVKQATPFADIEAAVKALVSSAEKQNMKEEIDSYQDKMKQVLADLKRVEAKLNNRSVSLEKWTDIKQLKLESKAQIDLAAEEKGAAAKALQLLNEKHKRFMEIEEKRLELDSLAARLEKLQTVFKGNGFVEFLAEEQLHLVAEDASERLGQLTRQRYAIEVDSGGGFIMRDDANGGVRRPVTSLSGGETFLTSLALALSLSSQIQLRGEYPLQFFFLDEGFGTLDGELLETVISALEKLQSDNLAVGVISHVQELRARLPRKLIVMPAEPTGNGTSVLLEVM